MSTRTSFCLFNARRLGLALLVAALSGCRRQPPEPDGLLAEARQLMQDGDFAAARDTLLQVSAEQPQSLTAQVNLALVYWKLGDFTAAAAALNRATELAPQDKRIWELRAHLLIQTGNPEGAIEVLGNIKNQDAATLTLRSLADQRNGNPDLALYHLEQALKRDRFHAPALHNLAMLQRDQMDAPVEAMAAWRRFREADPQNPRASIPDDAFLGEPATPEPPADGTPPGTGPAVKPTSGPTVRNASPTTEPPAALAVPVVPPVPPVPPATQARPQPVPPAANPAQTPATAQGLIQKANREIAAGNNDSALVVLKEAVQRYPDNADAVWALAAFYDKQLGLKERADGLYKTFLAMFPNDPRAKSIRTTTPPPPPKAPPAAASSSPDFFQKGLEHYGRQEWDAAIAAYRQALSMDPRSESCAYNLGLTYKAKNDLDAAAAAFRHALNIEPDMVKSLYMLGLTEIQRKRNADALTHLNRLIRIQPDFAKAHYLLGTVYQTENRPDIAAHHFERFLELDPDDKAAPQVKRWLEQHRR